MPLLPLSDAIQQMRAVLPNPEKNPEKTEIVPLSQAANRVLAEDVYSPINVPSFDNSAMDGYALNVQNIALNRPLVVAGKAFAGKPFESLPEGHCVRIMTGAKIPEGANAVVMQEHTTQHPDGTISLHTLPKQNENIRRIGEDVQQGMLVLSKGTMLNVTSLPLLASLGIASVRVFPRVKVAILSTGDELVNVGDPLSEGQIYDTNRFTLRLLLEKLQCDILDYGIVPDDPTLFEKIFTEAQHHADVLMTSGGVSVGEADFTKTVLEKLGNIGFWKIAMKPGKPFAFGKLPNAWFFGLPGNPVSALVTFYQLVQPALMQLAGWNDAQMAKSSAKLTACSAENLKKAVGRQDFQRGFYYANANGELEVRPVGHQSSHIFSAFHESNCFIVLEQERGNVLKGEKVTIQPFNLLLT